MRVICCWRFARLFFLAALATLGLSGCGHSPNQGRNYEVKGVLKEVRDGGAKALIAHEKIPGYMAAMTMEFDVRPTNSLAGFTPGDLLEFRMVVTETDGWIERVRKTGHTNLPAAQNQAAPVFPPELKAGDPLPDLLLTNSAGRSLHLSDFKGQALALTFIFTRCPFPVFCPRMNHAFAETRDLLSAGPGPTNWHFLSLSFDPEFDTPEQLQRYSAQYAPLTQWTFATGAQPEIRRLGAGFGLAFQLESGIYNHNLRTVVVNPSGRVHTVLLGNEWKASDLAEAMRAALSTTP